MDIFFIWQKPGNFVIKLSAYLLIIVLFFSLDQCISYLSTQQNYLVDLLKSTLPSEILILSVGLGWSLKLHFHQFPRNTDVAGLGSYFENRCSRSL